MKKIKLSFFDQFFENCRDSQCVKARVSLFSCSKLILALKLVSYVIAIGSLPLSLSVCYLWNGKWNFLKAFEGFYTMHILSRKISIHEMRRILRESHHSTRCIHSLVKLEYMRCGESYANHIIPCTPFLKAFDGFYTMHTFSSKISVYEIWRVIHESHYFMHICNVG